MHKTCFNASVSGRLSYLLLNFMFLFIRLKYWNQFCFVFLFMQSTVKLSSLNFPVFKNILSLSRGRICDAGLFLFLFIS